MVEGATLGQLPERKYAPVHFRISVAPVHRQRPKAGIMGDGRGGCRSSKRNTLHLMVIDTPAKGVYPLPDQSQCEGEDSEG